MSSYYFTSVPLKSTIDPTRNPHQREALERIPKHLLNQLMRERKQLTKLMASVRDAISKKDQRSLFHIPSQKPAGGLVGEEATQPKAPECEIITKLHGHLNKYLTAAYSIKKSIPEFRNALFFYWGESIGTRHNVAFCDLEYDVANLHFNLGAIEMERAAFVVWEAQDEFQLQAAEKVAYGALCTAAEHFRIAAELVPTVNTASGDGSTTHNLPPDVQDTFLTMMQQLALAQAQEIGAAKAALKEENKGKELIPKLCSQVLTLLNESYELGTKKVQCTSKDFQVTMNIIRVKVQLYRALTHAYAGSFQYDKDQYQEGLWHIREADEAIQATRQLAVDLKLLTSMQGCLDGCHSSVGNMVHKVQTTNRLVTRERAGEGPYPNPTAQVLSRPKPIAGLVKEEAVEAASLEALPEADVEDEDGFTLVNHPEDH